AEGHEHASERRAPPPSRDLLDGPGRHRERPERSADHDSDQRASDPSVVPGEIPQVVRTANARDRERRHSDPEERSQPGRDVGDPPGGTPGTDEPNNDRGDRVQSARYDRDGPERGEGQREPNGKQYRCRYGSAGREEGFGWQPVEAQAPRQHGPIQQGASDWSPWDVFPRARADHERERDQRQGRPR